METSKLLLRTFQKCTRLHQFSPMQVRTYYCCKVIPLNSLPANTHSYGTHSYGTHSYGTHSYGTQSNAGHQKRKTQVTVGLSMCNSHVYREYATSHSADSAVKSDLQEKQTSSVPPPPLPPTGAIKSLGSKKKTGAKRMPEDGYEVFAYGTSEHINLAELQEELEARQVYQVLTDLPNDLTDVLIVEAKYSIDNQKREVFFFRKGAVVFWNVPEIERVSILRSTRKFQKFLWETEESESLLYKYTDSPTCVISDSHPSLDIHLQKSPLNTEQILQKYAISNSLLASVKLAIYENQLEKRMDYFWAILLDLKQGKLRLTRDETLKQIGEQSMLRYYINMRSDLLDPPDFYWDRDALEQLYFQILDMYNIDKRTEVMNKKLDSSLHLIEILRDHLTNAHSSELEKLIIFLIFLEVLFSLEQYGLGPGALSNVLKGWLAVPPDELVDDAVDAALSEIQNDEVLAMDNPY